MGWEFGLDFKHTRLEEEDSVTGECKLVPLGSLVGPYVGICSLDLMFLFKKLEQALDFFVLPLKDMQAHSTDPI